MKAVAAILVALLAVGVLMYVYTAPVETSAEMTEAEIVQIEGEVVALMESVFEGARQLNVDMVMAACHPTDLGWVWSSVPRGNDRVRELWVNWFENKEAWDGRYTETTVKVLSKDAAVFQGIYEATITYKSGRIVRYPGNASWTSLMERTPDGWKITMLDGGAGTVEVLQEAVG